MSTSVNASSVRYTDKWTKRLHAAWNLGIITLCYLLSGVVEKGRNNKYLSVGGKSMTRKRQLGDILVAAGYLNQVQLRECLQIAAEGNRRLGEVVVEKKYLTHEMLYRILENAHNVSYVDLSRIDVNPAASGLVPMDLARRNTLVPVKIENNTLFVAIEDPKNFRALNEIRNVVQMDVKPLLASKESIMAFLNRAYGGEAAKQALSDYHKKVNLEEAVAEVVTSPDLEVSSSPIVRLVSSILERAVVLGASDIHIEPSELEVRVRMRVDGVLSSELSAPVSALNAIIARLKILGSLNIAERRIPQDGRFNIRVLNKEIDIRLSIIATVFGEKAVLRLLDRHSFFVPKSKLGFTEANIQKFDALLASPHGIILITGPTGSGKSTTLYTMLHEINKTTDNIVTIEDPVEYMMEGLNQVQVNHKAGVDFATGLRAILRQDPDVIMLGEIRDAETVEIAIRAAITGHLVLSTLHTNDALSSILRLVDMGIAPYLVSSAVRGVISQRLVRVICKNCITKYDPSPEEFGRTGIPSSITGAMEFRRGNGCPACNRTGYKGRMAVHEIATFDNTLRELVHTGASIEQLYTHARTQGMIPLKESALDLVRKGLTTLDEYSAIVYDI